MSSHTPGPWFLADKRFTGNAIIVSHGDPDGGGDSIADVSPCGPWVPEKTAEANARLIAAAPDLLEALKLMMTWMPSGFAPQSQAEAMEAAEAAIAKATGAQR